jgi:hypothetical protein
MGRHKSLYGQICSACKVDFPLEAFSIDRSTPLGLRRICKECNRARVAAWNLAHPKAAKQREIERNYAPARRLRRLEAYAEKHPHIIHLRIAREFQAEQLIEAVQWVEQNPGNPRATILLEAGITPYLWSKIFHLFDKTVVPSTPGPKGNLRKVTFSRNQEPYSVRKIKAKAK